MMKLLLAFVIVLFLVSCGTSKVMKEIDDLTLKVTTSSTATDEELAMVDLWKYIADNRILVGVFSVDENGKKTDINETKDVQAITNVHVEMSKDEQVKVLEWEPKDINNVFVLFRE